MVVLVLFNDRMAQMNCRFNLLLYTDTSENAIHSKGIHFDIWTDLGNKQPLPGVKLVLALAFKLKA